MKYTFFLDIDGTLIYSGNPRPTEALMRIVKEAQTAGHRFFINTARSYGNVNPKLFPIEQFDGLCSGCGTCITYEGKMIYENLLPPERVFQVAEHIISSQPDLKFVLEGIKALYAKPYNPWNPVAAYAFGSVAELKEKFPDIDVQKLATFAGEFLTQDTAKPLTEDFDVYFHPHYTEVVPKGYSKGKAAEIVENLLSIPHEATVAVGDSHNDIPMFKSCSISVAMGNAPEEVKREANTVTESVANDGAAKAIARLCGISYDRILRDIQTHR